MRRVRVGPLVVIALLAAAAAGAQGQRFRLPEGLVVPPKYPPATIEDSEFRICKLVYTSVRREANGMGWATDWPFAGIHLMTRLGELTRVRISRDRHGEPNHWTVRLMDDAVFQCQFMTASDVGTVQFSPAEGKRLREYLLKGGFLWVDDFWGTAAWNQWSAEIHRILPEFPIFDVGPDHPIRHTLFAGAILPQVPGINFWTWTGGRTAERGSDSAEPNFRAIADHHDRIMVVMTHNTDVNDSWEREGENSEFFRQFAPAGYALGVNVVLYSLTH